MNPPIENIRIHIVPTFRDFWRGVIWATFRQYRRLLLFAILLLVAFLASPLFPGDHAPMARYPECLIVPAVIFVFVPLSIYRGTTKRWHKSNELRSPRTYVFSDAGVEASGDTFNSQLAWAHYVTAYKSGDLIFLGMGQNQFTILPLRDFESPQQLARFIELVKSKVVKCRV